MAIPSIGAEPDRLNAEKQRQLHTPQTTLVSLVGRLFFGEDLGSRLDRCRYRRCREYWGERGCRGRREADSATSALDEATRELPIVVAYSYAADPLYLLEARPA